MSSIVSPGSARPHGAGARREAGPDGREAERPMEPPAERLVECLAGLVEGTRGGVRVLKQTRVVVIRVGDVVVKAHAPGTERAALTARLAAADRLGDVLLRPLRTEPQEVGGRLVTVWPAGEPVESVDPLDPFAAPWYEGGRLLARLHAVPLDALAAPAGPPAVAEPAVAAPPPMDAVPAAGGPGRVVAAVRALAGPGPDGPEARVIREAFAALPPPGGGRRGVTHGDWHLGQMARFGGRWTLIDIDDLGAGDPAWDLARPAAFFAAGVLAPEVWARFLAGYHEAGGWAVSAADPWRELDGPARALTVQLAAQAVARARDQARPLGEAEEAVVGSCARIAAMARRHTP